MKETDRVVILENVRSAYNVGNVIRTADSLGWNVRIVGYTPNPVDNIKVCKTALGAEKTVGLRQFDSSEDAIKHAREYGMQIFAAELTENSVSLGNLSYDCSKGIAVIFGNEIDGVQKSTLEKMDAIVEIPMQGMKESMNVGQSTAIFMRELRSRK